MILRDHPDQRCNRRVSYRVMDDVGRHTSGRSASPRLFHRTGAVLQHMHSHPSSLEFVPVQARHARRPSILLFDLS
jgi:hypothetical protein